jgi:hypothetical protein
LKNIKLLCVTRSQQLIVAEGCDETKQLRIFDFNNENKNRKYWLAYLPLAVTEVAAD